jgi:hypothetical protein
VENIKIFRGELNSELVDEITNFVNSGKVTAKSIAGGTIDPTGETLVSVGYTKEPSTEKLALSFHPLGNAERLSNAKLEKLLAAATQDKNAICHELLIKENGDIYTILLVRV